MKDLVPQIVPSVGPFALLGWLAIVLYGFATVVDAEPAFLDPARAYQLVKAGKLILIDVRSPGEWAKTGLPSGAAAISIHQTPSDFRRQVEAIAGGDRGRDVAVICAAGFRSNRAAKMLREAGFESVFDVPEGMLGGGAGPGWIARGLPTGTFEAGATGG